MALWHEYHATSERYANLAQENILKNGSESLTVAYYKLAADAEYKAMTVVPQHLKRTYEILRDSTCWLLFKSNQRDEFLFLSVKDRNKNEWLRFLLTFNC